MQLLLIIVGGLIGASAGGFGALLGLAVGWLVHRVTDQQLRIAALERRLGELQVSVDAQPRAVIDPAKAPPEAVGAAALDAAVASAPADPGSGRNEPVSANAVETGPEDAAGMPTPPSRSAAAAATDPAGAAAVQPVPSADALPTQATAPVTPNHPAPMGAQSPGAPATKPPLPLEPATPGLLHRLLFGGNTIVRVGVAILFLGLAFLARYASEHVQLPIEWRLAGIGSVALALLGLGWKLRDGRRAYAMALQGGAIAVLYLTCFAAFRFYGLVGMLPAFAAMVAIAGLAAALAVLQDAMSLAVIGALGGFATPLLLSTGSGDHVALFSYLLVLDLGIAAIAAVRHWRLLNGLAFACTYGIALAWGLRAFQPAHAVSCELFLVAFFLLFAAITLLPGRQAEQTDTRARWLHAGLLFGLPTLTFALQVGIVQRDAMQLAYTALVMGGFYVGVAAWSRTRERWQAVFEPALAIGAILLTLVIPLGFSAEVTAGAWALEGAGLLWAGLRQGHARSRWAGYALLALAGGVTLHAAQHSGTPAQVLNAFWINTLLIGAGSLAGAAFLRRADGLPAIERQVASPALIAWATVWLLAGAAYEVGEFVPTTLRLSALVAAVSAVAALYLLLARRLHWPAVSLPVAGHAPLMLLATAASADFQPAPLQQGGWWAWPIALAVHGAALAGSAAAWPMPLRRGVHALGPVWLAALGALELRHHTAAWGEAASAWPWLGWLVAPAAVLGLMLADARRAERRWPMRLEPQAYDSHAGGVLALSLLLWALLANAVSDGTARPLPHVPLLNPLDLGIGLAGATVVAWWRSDAAAPWQARHGRLGWWVIGGTLFAWLNGMLIRGFHHYGDIPYRLHAWIDSLAVQTGLTLLWSATALGLMWWSARQARRPVWLAGAGLLGVVVLKLLLVDLSGSGTVTRIVSFIGVGVLMLVIGYVAPLPGREAARAADEHAH